MSTSRRGDGDYGRGINLLSCSRCTSVRMTSTEVSTNEHLRLGHLPTSGVSSAEEQPHSISPAWLILTGCDCSSNALLRKFVPAPLVTRSARSILVATCKDSDQNFFQHVHILQRSRGFNHIPHVPPKYRHGTFAKEPGCLCHAAILRVVAKSSHHWRLLVLNNPPR